METITTPPTGVIVKSDSTGRTRYTSQYKAEVLAAYQRLREGVVLHLSGHLRQTIQVARLFLRTDFF